MRRHYLDHAASTPVMPAAREAYLEALGYDANPSSTHALGRAAKELLDEARERVAASVGAKPADVVFTSGGSEADNLAIKGLAWQARLTDPGRASIATSQIEHSAVGSSARWMATHQQFVHRPLPVDGDGRVLVTEALAVIRDPRTAVVSVMGTNNETGVIQPWRELAAAASEAGVYFHCDAVASAPFEALDFRASGASSLAISGHKIGAPVGVGALIIRRDLNPMPILHGGGQEREVRSGTQDLAGACALAAALEESQVQRAARNAKLEQLRDWLEADLMAKIPLITPTSGGRGGRAPGILHVRVAAAHSEALLFGLDQGGVCASSGSACHAGVEQPSEVLLAMGMDEEQARGGIRFSLGWNTEREDIEAAAALMPQVVERARSARRAAYSRSI